MTETAHSKPCPCGSGDLFSACCGPLIAGRPADNPQALMRSRYTAFTLGEIDYLMQSVHPDKRHEHDRAAIRAWSENAVWQGLEISETQGGGEDEERGSVVFTAHYSEKGEQRMHREYATFEKFQGRWFFYDGEAVKPKQVVRHQPKVGRNDPCPCGSGKKYKKCCARVS